MYGCKRLTIVTIQTKYISGFKFCKLLSLYISSSTYTCKRLTIVTIQTKDISGFKFCKILSLYISSNYVLMQKVDNSYNSNKIYFWIQRGTYIKGLFWPPLEQKIESCFSPISSYWFIRRIAQV